MAFRRSAVAVTLALSCGLASGSGVASRTLLKLRRAEDDASQMNAYAASVMEVLHTASQELEDAFATPPPPSAAATNSMKDQCGDWCGAAADSHCVTDCQAEMYQCNDHNKTRSDEEGAHDDCVAGVQAKFSSFLAKKGKGVLATPLPPAAVTLKATKDQCGDWCGIGADSHCVTDCQAEMYQCNDHNKTRSDEKGAHDDCVAGVQAKFSAAAHLLARKDQCGNWCGNSADSHCVTDCQAEMYQCNDHNKTRSDEKPAHDDCVAKVQAKFSAHFLAKKVEGVSSRFSSKAADKLLNQQDVLAKLFKHLKDNVAKFNKREKEGKVEADKAVKEMEGRLEKDRAQLKDPKLSAFNHELITNRTRTEEAELTFRKQNHFYQHNMFHANLKATHGLMDRVHGVLDAYKQALATGHVDPKIKSAMIKSLSSQPKALVETRRQLRRVRGLKRLKGAGHS